MVNLLPVKRSPTIRVSLAKHGSVDGDALDGCVHEAICKVARAVNLLNPSVTATADTAVAMERLADLAKYLPFISIEQVAGMEEEWTKFKALSVGVAAKQDVLAFFKLHQEELPVTSAAVCDLALIPSWIPSSSAACERVLSLLRHMFGNKQHQALQDYIGTAVNLASNKRST